ncbi:MAG: chemotaxis protein CheV [Desulfovibrionaceae bacterium]|nr:chemotaxis protein CheV [Desulfovibrionaceae bacterium]
MRHNDILLEAGTNEVEIVEFYLDETDGATSEDYRGYYAVNVAKVLEIIQMPKVTELPEVHHPSVLGAFNLRNQIIPLVDLSCWLDKPFHKDTTPKVIVTEFNNVTTAFMVSGVNRIHRISWEEVEPPTPYMASLSKDSINGVVKLEGRIIFLLDLEKIVADLNPQLGLKLDSAVDWSGNPSYRALVADDSTLIRGMIKDQLELANFVVEVHNNGRQAWERLLDLKQKAEEEGKTIHDYVQIVISDIEMPSMDGHNLTKRIKEDSQLKFLPVMLFSSLITDRLRHKGDSVGADEQVSKPEITTVARRAMDLIEKSLKDPSQLNTPKTFS